jgi:hypothetical protein
MSRIRSFSPSTPLESWRTFSASPASSAVEVSTARRPSTEHRWDASARPTTVSAVSADRAAVWASWLIVAVVSRTDAAVSVVSELNDETVESRSFAAAKSSAEVFVNVARFASSDAMSWS